MKNLVFSIKNTQKNGMIVKEKIDASEEYFFKKAIISQAKTKIIDINGFTANIKRFNK